MQGKSSFKYKNKWVFATVSAQRRGTCQAQGKQDSDIKGEGMYRERKVKQHKEGERNQVRAADKIQEKVQISTEKEMEKRHTYLG